MRRKGHAGGHKVSVRVTLAVTFSVRTAILLFFFPCTDGVMQFSMKNKCMEINTHPENSSKAKGQMLRAVQVRQRFQSDRGNQTSHNIWTCLFLEVRTIKKHKYDSQTYETLKVVLKWCRRQTLQHFENVLLATN